MADFFAVLPSYSKELIVQVSVFLLANN